MEKPIRFGNSASIKVAVLLVAMATIGSVGYLTYAEGGFAFRNPGAEDLVAAAQDYEPSEGLTLGNPNALQTILVGDSTMEQYIPRVLELISQGVIDLKYNQVVFDVHGDCPPILDIARDQNLACAPFVDRVLPTLDGDRVKTVVLTAWWTTEFTDAEYYLRSDPSKVLLRDSEAVQGRALDNLAALISHLVHAGKRIFVLLETPSSDKYDPKKLAPTGWRRGHLRLSYVRDHTTYIDQIFLPDVDHARQPAAHPLGRKSLSRSILTA